MSKGSDFLFGRTKCPELYKSLDDIAREVNTKLRMRGVGKGFVCVQEDLNKLILLLYKNIYHAYITKLISKRLELIEESQNIIKDVWIDIRFMYKNKALTVGEIGVLAEFANNIKEQLYKWHETTGQKL